MQRKSTKNSLSAQALGRRPASAGGRGECGESGLELLFGGGEARAAEFQQLGGAAGEGHHLVDVSAGILERFHYLLQLCKSLTVRDFFHVSEGVYSLEFLFCYGGGELAVGEDGAQDGAGGGVGG